MVMSHRTTSRRRLTGTAIFALMALAVLGPRVASAQVTFDPMRPGAPIGAPPSVALGVPWPGNNPHITREGMPEPRSTAPSTIDPGARAPLRSGPQADVVPPDRRLLRRGDPLTRQVDPGSCDAAFDPSRGLTRREWRDLCRR